MFKFINTYAIGGLLNIGYSDNTDMLIVLSSQGRGIFNCLTGEVTFRDDEDWYPDFDEINGTIKGFGSEINKLVKVAGVNSKNKLPIKTTDGWDLILTEPQPDKPPFERFNIQNIFLNNPSIENQIFITNDGPCELKAFGFSDTHKSFVVGLSCEITIWARI
jgi:hypothetical protein